jgi:glycerol-3-phosphate dehydrogenase (NAD(P)+)
VRLGEGASLADAIASTGQMVAEGVRSAAAIVALGRKVAVEMPICEAVADVCDGRVVASEAMIRLMTRANKSERS